MPFIPLSVILVGEILANFIRENKEIKGIKIGDTEYKVSQYADDTTLECHHMWFWLIIKLVRGPDYHSHVVAPIAHSALTFAM